MSRNDGEPIRRKGVSVWNWLGTLILSLIPGVNVLFFIVTILFAKTRAKRNFAIAALILMVLVAALSFAAFLIWGNAIENYARELAQR